MSSQTTQNRNLMYALVGGAALIGAAIVYKLLSSEADGDHSHADELAEPDLDEEAILEDLNKEQLATPQYDAQNKLDTMYFLKFLQFIGSNTSKVMHEIREQTKVTRRAAYQKEDWDTYREIVASVLGIEDKVSQKVLAFVLQAANIDEQSFGRRHQELSQHPQMSQQVMAAQQGKLEAPKMGGEPPKLTKQETLSHLKKSATIQMEAMKEAQANMPTQQPSSQQEYMEFMIEMMVQQSKSQDKIFFETGGKHENEDFEASLMVYSQKDPEVARELQAFMMQMQGGMGGGMPGM